VRGRAGWARAVLAVAGATVLGAAGGAGAAWLTSAAPAGAVTPIRTAWWNEAPLGLVLAPSGVGAGQLAVGQTTGSPAAVSALDYALPADTPDPAASGATLTLDLDPSSSFGTAAVVACPIPPADAGWKAGGDQTGPPPVTGCAAGQAVTGQANPAGTSLTFALTAAQQDGTHPGRFDLALVPDPSASAPFEAVFNQPTASDFTAAAPAPAASSSPPSTIGSAPAPTTAPAPGPAPGPTPSPAPSSSPAPAGGFAPSAGGSFSSFPSQAAPVSGPVASAPLPGSAPTSASSGPAATAASGQPGGVVATANPAATVGPSWLSGRRQRLLGVWLLVDAGLVLLLFGAGRERAPRLLGSVGAGRAEPEEGSGDGAEGEIRGVGRFARPRTAPPHRI
jgi:hypothetical protein